MFWNPWSVHSSCLLFWQYFSKKFFTEKEIQCSEDEKNNQKKIRSSGIVRPVVIYVFYRIVLYSVFLFVCLFVVRQCYDQKCLLLSENWIEILVYIPLFQHRIKAIGFLFATDLLSMVQSETSNKSHLFSANTYIKRPSRCNYMHVTKLNSFGVLSAQVKHICTCNVHN